MKLIKVFVMQKVISWKKINLEVQNGLREEIFSQSDRKTSILFSQFLPTIWKFKLKFLVFI